MTISSLLSLELDESKHEGDGTLISYIDDCDVCSKVLGGDQESS